MRRLLEEKRQWFPLALVSAFALLVLSGCLGTAPTPFEDEIDPPEVTSPVLLSGTYSLSLMGVAENSCSDVNPDVGTVIEIEVDVNTNAVTLHIPTAAGTYTVPSPVDGAEFAGSFENTWDWNNHPAQPSDCTEALYHYFQGQVTSETTFDLTYTLERSESAGAACATVPNALPCVEERHWAGAM